MTASSRTRSNGTPGSNRQRKIRESLRTRAFDSVGPKKYALQIQRASNGNPCLRIVQGTPNGDGTFKRFDMTIWSEDFDSFFNAMDDIHQYIRENDIKTPPGHKYDPRNDNDRRRNDRRR